jgi:hypothetical protein
MIPASDNVTQPSFIELKKDKWFNCTKFFLASDIHLNMEEKLLCGRLERFEEVYI